MTMDTERVAEADERNQQKWWGWSMGRGMKGQGLQYRLYPTGDASSESGQGERHGE